MGMWWDGWKFERWVVDGMGSNSGWWDGKVDGMVYVFVLLGLRCLLDCHVLKGFGIYMIGILDRLY